jgi:hypothetical protein
VIGGRLWKVSHLTKNIKNKFYKIIYTVEIVSKTHHRSPITDFVCAFPAQNSARAPRHFLTSRGSHFTRISLHADLTRISRGSHADLTRISRGSHADLTRISLYIFHGFTTRHFTPHRIHLAHSRRPILNRDTWYYESAGNCPLSAIWGYGHDRHLEDKN